MGFLPHELGEGELLVKISIHGTEEILNFFPGSERLVIPFISLFALFQKLNARSISGLTQ